MAATALNGTGPSSCTTLEPSSPSGTRTACSGRSTAITTRRRGALSSSCNRCRESWAARVNATYSSSSSSPSAYHSRRLGVTAWTATSGGVVRLLSVRRRASMGSVAGRYTRVKATISSSAWCCDSSAAVPTLGKTQATDGKRKDVAGIVRAMAGRFMTMQDVADELATSLSQIYHMVRSGELPAIKIGGRGQWRIERSKLEEYIARKYEETAEFVRNNPLTEPPADD